MRINPTFIKDMQKFNAKVLAEKYGRSLSTIYKWMKKVKDNPEVIMLQEYEIDGYILGILWGVGYDTGEFFYVRHKNHKILELLKDAFKQDSKIVRGKSNTNEQWRLKIRGDARKSILSTLSNYGWTPRNADVRDYPKGNIDHKGFIKAWIELHSSFDYNYGKKKKPRLRIYGNKHLIEQMNVLISDLTGVSRKTPQRLHNCKTYALYYVSVDTSAIFNYFGIKH